MGAINCEVIHITVKIIYQYFEYCTQEKKLVIALSKALQFFDLVLAFGLIRCL